MLLYDSYVHYFRIITISEEMQFSFNSPRYLVYVSFGIGQPTRRLSYFGIKNLESQSQKGMVFNNGIVWYCSNIIPFRKANVEGSG